MFRVQSLENLTIDLPHFVAHTPVSEGKTFVDKAVQTDPIRLHTAPDSALPFLLNGSTASDSFQYIYNLPDNINFKREGQVYSFADARVIFDRINKDGIADALSDRDDMFSRNWGSLKFLLEADADVDEQYIQFYSKFTNDHAQKTARLKNLPLDAPERQRYEADLDEFYLDVNRYMVDMNNIKDGSQKELQGPITLVSQYYMNYLRERGIFSQ